MKLNVNIKPHRQETVTISTPFIRLDALLKFKGEAETGGQAKQMIQDGLVKVNGMTTTSPGLIFLPLAVQVSPFTFTSPSWIICLA